jgi:hypothetical protein
MTQAPVPPDVVQVNGPPAGLPETGVAVNTAPSASPATEVAPVRMPPACTVIDAFAPNAGTEAPVINATSVSERILMVVLGKKNFFNELLVKSDSKFMSLLILVNLKSETYGLLTKQIRLTHDHCISLRSQK